jgi:hypothetical protein
MNSIRMGSVYGIQYTQINGDAMALSASDLLFAQGMLEVGQSVPDGWTVLTGNAYSSMVYAVGYRFQFIEAVGLKMAEEVADAVAKAH